MQITVFGASGRVGVRVVELALKKGYTVVAFVHSRNPFQGTPRLIVHQGDIRNPRDVEAALKHSKAVVSCLGSWHSKRKDILSTAMRVIIPEMQAHRIRRIVTLTGADALAPGETPHGSHKLAHILLKIGARKVLGDGEVHMQLLSQSKLAWTTIRSPIMNNFGKRGYRLGFHAISPLATIRRQAVARALVAQIIRPDYVGKAPFISRK
jgi:putative NADH-flavin reductase